MRITLQQAAAWSSITAAILVAFTLLLATVSDVVVTETELRDALAATETELRDALATTEAELREELRTALASTEQRITNQLRSDMARIDAQMEEFRRYMVNHLDRHAAGASPLPE